MDKVRKPSNSVCYTPSSEPYKIIHIVQLNVDKCIPFEILSKGKYAFQNC
jgi:hypothetical protein